MLQRLQEQTQFGVETIFNEITVSQAPGGGGGGGAMVSAKFHSVLQSGKLLGGPSNLSFPIFENGLISPASL